MKNLILISFLLVLFTLSISCSKNSQEKGEEKFIYEQKLGPIDSIKESQMRASGGGESEFKIIKGVEYGILFSICPPSPYKEGFRRGATLNGNVLTNGWISDLLYKNENDSLLGKEVEIRYKKSDNEFYFFPP